MNNPTIVRRILCFSAVLISPNLEAKGEIGFTGLEVIIFNHK
jgi:hypothetical protein